MESQIENLLLEKFQEEGLQDCFLLEITLHPFNKLDVVIDSDTGVTIEKCQKISRYLEAKLDENLWIGAEYGIEVGSPGATSPLVYPRQYPKHIGRPLSVTIAPEGEIKKGILTGATEEQITLEEKIVRVEGKKKIKETILTAIPFTQIQKATVELPF